MKIEEKFNKRSADLIAVQQPSISVGTAFALDIKLKFFTAPGVDDLRTLSMHMTPYEALQLAESLINAARRSLDRDPASLNGNEART